MHKLKKNKKKIISIQANNLNQINFKTDTTLLLSIEAQKRGYKIFWYETKNLSLKNKKIYAKGFFVKLSEKKKDFYDILKSTELDLSKSKYLLIRQNPPFNMEYVMSTLYLEKLIDKVRVINNPTAVRNISEKFYSSKFLRFMPPTIFSKNIETILRFYKKHKIIVIKPIDGHGGNDILFLKNKFKISKISKYLDKKGHVMVQKFIPAIKKGDKRVFIINGKVCGAIKRIPPKNSILSNISQGGKAFSTQLSANEKKISNIVGNDLIKNNIYFAGIDFVSGYLIGDINVTSPTGLTQYKDLTGINLAKTFWSNLPKLK